MDYRQLADIVFADVTETPGEIEAKYPKRVLPEGAGVTRFAPSPTGFIHLGGLYQAVLGRHIANQSGGVFFLRIEDTDRKRFVEGAVENIISSFADFGISFDEGATADGDKGDYGPYRQSERKSIYRVFAKKLMAEGRAYPCFCTEQQLEELHALQSSRKDDPGYYGEYAVCRNLTPDEAAAKIKNGESFTVRFRSEGNKTKTFKFKDEIKGELELPQNFNDFVLLKTDGIPTYHFAHVIDDHLMGTTVVIRGEEWLSTVCYHTELFRTLGFRQPKYAHTAQIMKNDEGGKRKLSKRKDPEAAVSYYVEKGYPAEAVKEYLMTLLSSAFEDWRRANKTEDISAFQLKLNKMSVSGCLFDGDKLDDISKTVMSMFTAEEIVSRAEKWAPLYDERLAKLLEADKETVTKALGIGRGGAKPRKDITVLSDIFDYLSYLFDEYFVPSESDGGCEDAAEILKDYADMWSPEDDNTAWFEKIKAVSEKHGYCPSTKDYKASPDGWKGHAGTVSTAVRLAVTGRENTPDLCEIMKILGKEKVIKRLNDAVRRLSK